MRRLGLLWIAGAPVRVYTMRNLDHWGGYFPEERTIIVSDRQDRHLLVSTLVHEIWHAVERLELAGTRANEELRAQQIGKAIAQNWDELVRIANKAKVRK
jgi:hypothetical protein